MNTSRFQSGAGKDNTSRILNNEFQNPTYAASIALVLNKANTVVKIALTGALTLTAGVGTSTTPPNIGDTLTVLLAADGSARIVTFSTGIVPDGTLTVAASKKATAAFMFDGVAWLETARTIQP